MMLMCCTQNASEFGKLSIGHRSGKGQFSFQSQRRANYCIIVLILDASKVMLKILQIRLQQYMNGELPGVQSGFRKGRGTRDQIANIPWIIEKTREFQKNIYFCFTNCTKDFVRITTNCGKFLKKWEYQTTLSVS